MILNENYFDDLKLTDDDIESSDDNYILPNHNTDDYDYANPKEYYKVISSKYSHYIVLDIETEINNVLTDSVLWNNKIPRMLKKLFYLFESYGIEYSEPVVSEKDYYVSYLIQTELKGCKFFDFHEYKLITNRRTLNDALETLEHDMGVLLFFNPPKTQSYTTVCKFIGNIMKILWRNEDYDTFVNIICAHSVHFSIQNGRFTVFNPFKYNNAVIDKTSIEKPVRIVVNIINLFFPEKKYDDIEEELTEDKQLLLKLYNCFPDY